ncbi:MAG: gliding motility-associated ABC transporter substrate-binding protein GldG [Flavobacteriaceae bacterium]|nr:gliding motility-associated ABC transporter substrate-binding protein GldG [Flavobacteriaceae bacterium]|tara:strand:- start:21439 stop:23085 length:1647 start_codon:yes stop_codon:yes gene_type:complete
MKKIDFFVLFIIFLILFTSIPNIFSYKSIDITTDKKFTLSKTTISKIKELEKPLIIDILLEGSMPNYYYTFQNQIKETIKLFINENDLISYNFVDPYDVKQKKLFFQKMADFGIDPEILILNKNNNRKEYKIYPWAILTYNKKSVKIKLIEDKIGDSEEDKIIRSTELLEHKLIDGLIKLTIENKPKISFLNSHGTSEEIKIFDFKNSISKYYDVSYFNLKKSLNAIDALNFLKDKKTLIISNPTENFSEKEKFILDQYSLNGGKIIWLINAVIMNLEMLYNENSKALAIANELNLEDLFFHNGIKLRKELIKDLYCAPIVVATGSSNSQYIPYPWLYFPIIKYKNQSNENNLDLLTNFVSPIDTIKTTLNRKIILKSSDYTKILTIPNYINLSEVNNKINPSSFDNKNYIIGIELSGNFVSFYKNKTVGQKIKNKIYEGVSKWLIISDGNIAENQIDKNKPLKLGYDKWTNNSYSNKEFLITKIHEFSDNKSLLNPKSKKINRFEVDKFKLNKNLNFWRFSLIIYPFFISSLLYLLMTLYLKSKFRI